MCVCVFQLQIGQVAPAQKNMLILQATIDLEPDTYIIEYQGKVMLKQELEDDVNFFKKYGDVLLSYFSRAPIQSQCEQIHCGTHCTPF